MTANERPIAEVARLRRVPDSSPIGQKLGGVLIAALPVSFSASSPMATFQLRLLAFDLTPTGHKSLQGGARFRRPTGRRTKGVQNRNAALK